MKEMDEEVGGRGGGREEEREGEEGCRIRRREKNLSAINVEAKNVRYNTYLLNAAYKNIKSPPNVKIDKSV